MDRPFAQRGQVRGGAAQRGQGIAHRRGQFVQACACALEAEQGRIGRLGLGHVLAGGLAQLFGAGFDVEQVVADLEGQAECGGERVQAGEGVGIGILTSLDVMTEVKAGLLSFTRISDPVLRPMTLALCTAAARTPSHAAGIVLAEIENTFHELGFPVSLDQKIAGDQNVQGAA